MDAVENGRSWIHTVVLCNTDLGFETACLQLWSILTKETHETKRPKLRRVSRYIILGFWKKRPAHSTKHTASVVVAGGVCSAGGGRNVVIRDDVNKVQCTAPCCSKQGKLQAKLGRRTSHIHGWPHCLGPGRAQITTGERHCSGFT